MSTTQTLSESVEAIEKKADRKEKAENIEEQVATARGTLSRLNSDIEELAEAVKELQFYRQLLNEMFGGSELPGVRSALNKAESAVRVNQSEVVDALVEDTGGGTGTTINEIKKDVTDAISSVSKATESVKNRLRAYKNEWEERLSSARHLQQIIGAQNDEFANTVRWLEEIVNTNMWDPDQSASTVITTWEKATNQWEKHQDLQGIDAFQQTHGLSDDAVKVIEQLSSRSSLALSDVDVDVLGELKEIDQLAEAVELSI